MGVTIWQLVVPPIGKAIVPYVITAVSVFGAVVFLFKAVTTPPQAGMIPPSMEGPISGTAETVRVG
jgi:hypothetical protein